MDREKVIKGLECCTGLGCHHGCEYLHNGCTELLKKDALALLKEQVSQGVVDQIRWERDMALSQLEQIGKGLGSKMDDIVALLKEQEVVIRCKDCKFRYFDQDNIPYCELPDHEVYPSDDWFCADGIRKD